MNKEEKLEQVKDVAIYLRISIEKKIKGKRMTQEETLDNHRTRLIDFCHKNGYGFTLFEEVVSGGKKDIGERPELQRLLNQLTNFDAILVIEISRISRDTFISALVKQKVNTFDKLILTPEYTYYLKDQNDALMYDFNSMISSHERETIGKRIKHNKLEMTKRGLNASGSVPIGYIRNAQTKKLEINPITAHIPATAFYLNSIGYGSKRISEIMNELGFKTARGAMWTNTTIKDLLKKETYKGFTVYHDYETKTFLDADGNEIKKREIKDTIHIENTHPAIINPIKFNQLAMKRQERGVKYGQSFSGGKFRERTNTTGKISMLKDLIFCGMCGKKKRISYDKNRDELNIRSCPEISADGTKCECNGMKADALEKEIIEKIFEHRIKLETEIQALLKNDTKNINLDYQNQKVLFGKQLADLKKESDQLGEIRITFMLEKNEDMQKKIQGKMKDNEEAQEKIKIQLEKINEHLNAPKIENEIQKRTSIIDIINKVEKESDVGKINNFLKHFIARIRYSRVIPEDIKLLGAKSPERQKVKANIKIDFI
jgi:DNA invertase Pin-like site-specific DNA recombinase